MKDYVIELAKPVENKMRRLNIVREYLQIYALRTLHERGYFNNLAFVGGTCLRFTHNLTRFSEDLDFSLTMQEGYDFETILNEIEKDFLKANYTIKIKHKTEKTVHTAFLKVSGLLYEVDLSNRVDQNLTIKLDIDTNPPQGAKIERTLVNKYFPISLCHYELPSLFAGKLHAILTRPYVKGRDYFDLVWILSKWRDINPNIELLKNALKQTGSKIDVTLQNWKGKVWDHVKDVKWDNIRSDVEKFAEYPEFITSIEPKNIKSLLE